MMERQTLSEESNSQKDSNHWTAVSQSINSLENHKSHQVILPNEKTPVRHDDDQPKDIFTTITDKIEEITENPTDAVKVTAIGAGALALAYIIHKPGILTRLSPRAFFRSGAAEAEALEHLAARKLPTSIIGREGRLSAKEIEEWEKFVFEPANPQTYVRPVNRPPNTGGFEFEDWELGLPLD
jgi:hypothetical protein